MACFSLDCDLSLFRNHCFMPRTAAVPRGTAQSPASVASSLQLLSLDGSVVSTRSKQFTEDCVGLDRKCFSLLLLWGTFVSSLPA